MRTMITAAALAAGAFVFGQSTGQEKSATSAQEPVTPRSMYHDCLLVAGPSTWQAIGLSGDQTSQAIALQGSYQAEQRAMMEAEKSGSSKQRKATALSDNKATTREAGTTSGDLKADKTQAEPPAAGTVEPGTVVPPVEADKTNVTTAVTSAMDPALAPIDQQLHAILTPEQLALWDRRCGPRTSMQP